MASMLLRTRHLLPLTHWLIDAGRGALTLQ